MKPLLLGLTLLLPACVATAMKTPKWQLTRVSFLSNQQIPSLSLAPDGTATLTGYQSKPDAQSVAAITQGIVQGVKGF